jgi:hypothetical protein
MPARTPRRPGDSQSALVTESGPRTSRFIRSCHARRQKSCLDFSGAAGAGNFTPSKPSSALCGLMRSLETTSALAVRDSPCADTDLIEVARCPTDDGNARSEFGGCYAVIQNLRLKVNPTSRSVHPRLRSEHGQALSGNCEASSPQRRDRLLRMLTEQLRGDGSRLSPTKEMVHADQADGI